MAGATIIATDWYTDISPSGRVLTIVFMSRWLGRVLRLLAPPWASPRTVQIQQVVIRCCAVNIRFGLRCHDDNR